MIDFYLNHLNLSKSDVQKTDLSDEFQNQEKKIIYVVQPINKCCFFQKKIHKLRKEINDDQYLVFRFQTLKGRIRRIEKKKTAFLIKNTSWSGVYSIQVTSKINYFQKNICLPV